MKSNYRALSELIEKVDERNDDGAITELIGVSIDKCFIKSVANTNGTDLSKYKIIRKNEFAVSLMQVSRDSKIPVARLEDYEVAIMSPAYPIFRVKDTRKILPEYLDMWFKRPEFDREAAFIAVGGVRGSMPWEEFVKMKLPVPTIEKQLEIVNSYKAITERIALKQKINDNLEAQAEAIYNEMIANNSTNGTMSTTRRNKHNKNRQVKLRSSCNKRNINFLPVRKKHIGQILFSFDQEAVLLAGNNASAIYPLKIYCGKFDVYQRHT